MSSRTRCSASSKVQASPGARHNRRYRLLPSHIPLPPAPPPSLYRHPFPVPHAPHIMCTTPPTPPSSSTPTPTLIRGRRVCHGPPRDQLPPGGRHRRRRRPAGAAAAVPRHHRALPLARGAAAHARAHGCSTRVMRRRPARPGRKERWEAQRGREAAGRAECA